MTLQNYCGVLQVLSALQQTPVQRLKDTWKEVNPKSTKALQELGDIFQPLNNWRLARDLLHRNQPPSIPYIGAPPAPASVLACAIGRAVFVFACTVPLTLCNQAST